MPRSALPSVMYKRRSLPYWLCIHRSATMNPRTPPGVRRRRPDSMKPTKISLRPRMVGHARRYAAQRALGTSSRRMYGGLPITKSTSALCSVRRKSAHRTASAANIAARAGCTPASEIAVATALRASSTLAGNRSNARSAPTASSIYAGAVDTSRSVARPSDQGTRPRRTPARQQPSLRGLGRAYSRRGRG